ncbi:hypothetical protein L207DRAFT_511746 [Hyaloscypha variabilis F]|uniref:Rhodopsin domain-containing protein n=1 Tax=Hyaloscypha variabilis (strain UAMH 11265 / GT02V1 / F) TaxID=1149755 RepID=A0A2J6RNW4_HYAVF|nr:hypothetical protein L207DRAFT_511746 [Hyaloscypha variabilis F]
MSGTLPPLFIITDNDHGGYVAVTLYTLLVLMVLLVTTRVFTRWYVVKTIKLDDVFLMLAAVLGIVQSVCVQFAIDYGLGRTRATVADSDFDLYQKYEYAAQILLIAAMACAKLSLVLLIQSLLAEKYSLLAGRGLLAIIIVWAIGSILAQSFQCSIPHPWDSTGNCNNQLAIHDAIASVNIITDASLILLPCVVFVKIQVSKSRRYGIMALFATRILVCVATGVQARYFKSFTSSADKTWASTDSSVWDQAMMNLSIICAAIPSLGRLIIELQPTVNTFAITQHHGLSRNDRYILSSIAGRVPRDYAVNNKLGGHTSILGGRDRVGINDDSESTEGLREEDGPWQNQNTIKQTMDVDIRYLPSV